MNLLDRLLNRAPPAAPIRQVPTQTPMEQIDSLGSRRNPLAAAQVQEELDLDPQSDQLDPEEWKRILGLPVRTPATEADIDPESFTRVDARAYDAGFRLRVKQIDSLREFDAASGLLAQVNVGGGKCCREGTTLYNTLTGCRELIESATDLYTPSMNERTGQIRSQHAIGAFSGEKPCVRLTLQTGQTVELSTDHPVFTQRGWVEAQYLAAADLVAVPRRLPEPASPLNLEPHLISFLALMIADGGYSQPQARFTDDNQTVLDEFKLVVTKLGGYCTPCPRANCGRATEFNVNGMRLLLRSWGMQGQLSKDKRIPASLYGLNSLGCALFLNRFIACDGHLNLSKRQIEIVLASRGLIDDLQHLLLRLGVISTKRYKQAKIGHKKFDAWRLVVSGKENVQNLLNWTGPILGQEQKTKQLLELLSSVKWNSNIDVVPISIQHYGEFSAWFPHGKKRAVQKLHLTAEQYLSRKAFESWVAETGYDGELAWLASTDLLWARVLSVEPSGIHPVYDLQVDSTHSWIANGIVVHNTLLSVSLADRGIRRGARRALILVPAQVYQQLIRTDLPFLRARLPLGCAFVGLGGTTPARRWEILERYRGQRGITFVMPYSLLSRPDARKVLEEIDPRIVVADEAHYLKDRHSARTKRFLDFMRERPDCLFCAMSGTLTSKSLAEYHHLAILALRERAPLPKGATQGALWAQFLDSNSLATAEKAKALQPLRTWAHKHTGLQTPYTIDGFREAYRARLESAPGCVLSRKPDDLETSLIFDVVECELPEGSVVHEHLKNLEQLWQSPTGEELAHAIHLYKWRYELTAGFYYALLWPEPKNDAHRELIDRAKEHHFYQQEYHKQLRDFLNTTSMPGLDTPMLVGGAIARREKLIPKHLAAAWHEMKQREFEGMPERVQHPVRLDDYKVQKAVEWARGKGRGIIWVHHQEMVNWICEAAPFVIPARAGDLAIMDKANADKVFVASMSAHGTGKNLQHFSHQLFVQWPRPANHAEQVIGRTHRPGQEADEMTVELLMGIDFDHQLFCATLADALYIELTTGAQQKILYGSYATPPKIYEPRLLDKLGFQGSLKKVDGNKLREKFGA